MAFVPEGQYDRSLARSAWDIVTPKKPSRRVRSDFSKRAHFDSVIEVLEWRSFGCEHRRIVPRDALFDEEDLRD